MTTQPDSPCVLTEIRGNARTMDLPVLSSILASLGDWRQTVPVIVSLVIIEGLLSVDNALAIAAMARHLPEAQRIRALRFGIIGAYFFRGVSMALAAWIIENPWVKIGGAAYLICLMSKHFTDSQKSETEAANSSSRRVGGFISTVVSIEIMDLSLSVDNVVAAVAMSPRLWVVCTGVFIGILALRFVAGACLKLMEKHPILEEAAFLLIGYVGLILLVEILSDPQGGFQLLPGPIHITAPQKFVGIVVILASALVYSKSLVLQKVLMPILKIVRLPMFLLSGVLQAVQEVLGFPFYLARRAFK
jgi:YkoY family integral membrane protein